MITLLHSFSPKPIIFFLGPFPIHWYGLFIVLGIISALFISFYIGERYYKISKDTIFDLAFYLIIGGIIGARIYDIFLQLPYYIDHPWQTLQIWKGGLAIHGAFIAGLFIIYIFSRHKKIPFFKLTSLLVPGLAIGQAIGRFGNYFNQELFGKPTNLSWGIPINIINRPAEYILYNYFHPTFLYESLGSILIFIVLFIFISKLGKKQLLNLKSYIWLTSIYMILYSILRFFLEFIRIDYAPKLFNIRWPQIISLIIICIFLFFTLKKNVFNTTK